MIILVGILFPILAGLLLPVLKLNKTARNVYVVLTSLITSGFVFCLAFMSKFTSFTLLHLNKIFSIGFKIDGLSSVFLLIVITLWPIATLYATEYMEHEENQDSFFRYYLIAFGIAIGLASSKNAITMYLFYELLTFLTLPLIMHDLYNKQALYAGKIYLIVSVFGAAMALVGITILTKVVPSVEFVENGVIDAVTFKNNEVLLNIAYTLCFMGFGVKAAILPFTFWLPTCSVAPTPVSALLHAVAVVKAGTFAIMRATFYLFGNENMYGSVAQRIAIVLAIITIIYSSIMAVKEKQIKRRLAYSTASNLSYILFVATLMTRAGYVAGMAHMMFHAIMKINLFFVAGAIMIYSHRENVSDMKGMARKMPIAMFAFLVAALAMVGMPLTCGFVSKYGLITAAIQADTFMALAGIIAIVISSILTLVYLFSIVIAAYIPGADFDYNTLDDVKAPGKVMNFVFILITIMIIYFGIGSASLLEFIEIVAKGIA